MPIVIIFLLVLFPSIALSANDYQLQCSIMSAEKIAEQESIIRAKAAQSDVIHGLHRYGVIGDPVTYIFAPKGHAAYPSVFKLVVSTKKGERRWQHSGFTAGNLVACSKQLCEFDPICKATSK